MRPFLFKNKKMIQKTAIIFIFAFVIFAGVTVAPHTVYAQFANQNLESVGAASGLGTASLGTIVARIIRIFLGTLGAIAIGITLYGGFLWMTARGDEAKVQKAKDVLRNGAIGLTIILSSYAITEFIISRLQGAVTGGAGGEITEGGAGAGGLGSYVGMSALGRVIESHDPVRDATEVPRNKNIIIKFKFPIKPDSIVDTSAGGVVEQEEKIVGGKLNTNAIKIYESSKGKNEALKSEDVNVSVVYDSEDGESAQTFVLDPQVLLGSAAQDINYSVHVGPAVQKISGTSAFTGLAADYVWSFTVSTNTDLTPPRVISIMPVPDATYSRNIVLQVTFSEPINPSSAVGLYKKGGNSFQNFQNITVRKNAADGELTDGRWQLGPGFNIVEFLPTNLCGTNSCGQKIYCLPAPNQIFMRARSGTLADPTYGSPEARSLGGFDGVVDTSNNALDGGGDKGANTWSVAGGKPAGSPTDDYFMKFLTDDNIKITAPVIESISPGINAGEGATKVTESDPVIVQFDSLMRATSFDGIQLLAQAPKAQAGYWKSVENIAPASATTSPKSKLTVNHVPFASKQSYAPIIPSTVTDSYQNCFLPSGGPGCGGTPPTALHQYCCNGNWTTDSCGLLNYGK